MKTPRTEFAQAIRAIATERKLDSEVILDTIRQAIIAAYKRDARERGEETEGLEFEVEMNPTSGEAKIFAWPIPEEVDEEETDGKKEDKPIEKKEVTPPGFGRIAAQTAKQVIHQKIREAEKSAIMDEFSGRIGSLISGMVLRFDGPDVRIDLGRTEGLMPVMERVTNERLNLNQRLSFLMKEIVEGAKGKQIVLSRADPDFVKKLFAREVPEISSGSVEIKSISREPGVRTKITVFSNQSGVDPVGSCVGQKGVRVQAVTNELGGERVDIIPFTDNMADLIVAALSPAEGLSVTLDDEEKIAKVKAPEDQLSLAIGKDGQNVRLAAKLTGWKIKIEELLSGESDKKDGKMDEAGKDEPKVKKVKSKKKKVVSKPKKSVKKKTDDKVSDDKVQPQGDDDDGGGNDEPKVKEKKEN
ncbi:transcription termination factor NusA [Patescibacteria group bacterium]|nr:transcription termination factor NusA [Patescibacteria group bacterium]